jgi:RNA-binding protein YlmH
MQSVEASMRLDAVASAGMGMSRGKLKDMIEGGDVLVNWKEVRFFV